MTASHRSDEPVEGPATVVNREHERYGGVKIGSVFFGWLAASGVAVLLTALIVGTGAAVGLGTKDVEDLGTIGLVGGILLVVVLFVAYFCGGYVAGRMARFDGAKQGLAVWLWALLIAVVVAVVVALAGDQFNILAQVNTFPRIPVNEGDLTTGGIIAAVLAVLVTLLGAVLGGMAGVRYHRKVDRAGLLP